MSERCYHSFHETGRCPRCDGEPEQVTRLREALRELREAVRMPLDALIGDIEYFTSEGRPDLVSGAAVLKKLADVRAALGDTPDE
jgi:hypothetical protein